MKEAFCGKNCAECAWREELQCAGCQSSSDKKCCEIASCCREKGHGACHTCTFQLNCQLLQTREEIPQRCRQAREEQAVRRQWHAQNAPVLGKWIWLMFWLIVPSIIGGVMKVNFVVETVPMLKIPGEILKILCSVFYALFLWKLQDVDSRYKKAAKWLFVSIPIAAVATFVRTGNGGDLKKDVLLLLVLLPSVALEYYAGYLEFHSHGDALAGLDDELSEKWPKLWKWEIGLFLGLFGCILLLLIGPLLALLAFLADAIGLVVVAILRLVYLYRTAKLFREYTVPDTMTLPEQATTE